MLRPRLVVLNAAAGNGGDPDLAGTIEALFAKHGKRAEVRAVSGDALAALLRRERGRPGRQLVAAGGDGTVRSVAKAVVGTAHTMAILPLGTMNLIARTLGIPMELEAAVEVAVTGIDRALDVCSANGHLVVSNVSAGPYAEMSRAREQRRPRHAHWPRAMRWLYDTSLAFFDVARRWHHRSFVISVDGQRMKPPSPFFLVSNNDYEPMGRAHRRNDGRLTLLVPRTTTPLATLWAAVKSAALGPRRTPELEVRRAGSVRVLGQGTVAVSIDGEVQRMSLPIELVPIPKALTIRVPR